MAAWGRAHKMSQVICKFTWQILDAALFKASNCSTKLGAKAMYIKGLDGQREKDKNSKEFNSNIKNDKEGPGR